MGKTKDTKNEFLNLTNLQINVLFFFLILLIVIVYSRVFKNSLTNWDDEMYVLDNPFIRSLSLKNIYSIFSSYFAGNYHPLTQITYAINYKISHLQPWSYQLFNLFFHLCNVLYIYIFVKQLFGLQYKNQDKYKLVPVFVSVIFGLHTLQVESVAWVSERKNVLYAFFFLLSLIYYIKFIKSCTYKLYLLSVIMFLLSLLSKGMAVPLTLCIFVIDYFAGRKILSKKVIIEKLPFIILSFIFGIIALNAQRTGGATIRENYITFSERIVVAAYGFTQYILKLVYPFNLSAYYPYPVKLGTPLPFFYYGYLIIPMLILFLIWRYFRYNKLIIFGTLFFIANIILVLQIIPVGDAVIADRYVYIPLIGFFLIFSFYLNELLYKFQKYQITFIMVFIVYCYAIGFKTYQRIGVWRNSFSLWNDSIKKYPENNDRGYLNRGNINYEKGDYIKALIDYNKLLQIDSVNSGGYIGRALIKQAMGEYPGALGDYNIALSLRKTYEGYLNRAVLKMFTNDYDKALNDLDSAYSLNPLRSGVHINKGVILFEKEKYNEAIEQFNAAINKDPANYKPYIGRGKAKHALNNFHGAMDDFNISLAVFKSFEGYLNRAVLKISMKDFDEARNDLSNAYFLQPNSSDVFINMGIIEIEQNDYIKAIEELNKAVGINSNNYKAYLYLGIAKFKLKEFNLAIEYLDECIQLRPDKLAYYYRGLAHIEIKNNANGCNDLEQSFSMGYNEAGDEIKNNCK